MKLFLIISPKNVYTTRRLLEEAGKLGVAVECIDVVELASRDFSIDMQKYSGLCIRQRYPYFNEVFALAKKFAESGKRVVDGDLATGIPDSSKWDMYERLKDGGVEIPRTVVASVLVTTPSRQGGTPLLEKEGNTAAASFSPPAKEEYPELVEGGGGFAHAFQYPLIAKWIYGFSGQHVYKVESKEELERVLQIYKPEELLLQEYIPAEYEYRVFTIGYRSLPVMLRYRHNQKSARVDQSAYEVFKKEDAPHVAALAEKSARILSRELSRSDILEKDGKPFLLETNRFPGIESFERNTGYNVAKEFVEYLVR